MTQKTGAKILTPVFCWPKGLSDFDNAMGKGINGPK